MSHSQRIMLFAGLTTLVFFGFTLLYLIPSTIEVASFIPPFAISSKAWPQAISILGLSMGVLLIIFSRKQSTDDLEEDAQDEKIPQESMSTYLKRLAVISASFFCFVIIVPSLGFLISAILLVVFLIATIQKPGRYLQVALFGTLFTLFVFIIFTKLIHTQFPVGHVFKSFGF